MEIMGEDLLTFFIVLGASIVSHILFRIGHEKRKDRSKDREAKIDSNFYYLLGFTVVILGATMIALLKR